MCVCVSLLSVCMHRVTTRAYIIIASRAGDWGLSMASSPPRCRQYELIVSFFWVRVTSFACVFIKGQTPLRTHKKVQLALQAAAAAVAC